MTSYSPPPPTVSGTQITVSYLVNNPVLVQRILRALVLKRLIGGRLLTGRVDVTGSGSAVFETSESIFATDAAELIDELAEYPLTDTPDGALSVYTVGKYGLATDIPNTLITRNRMDIVSRKLVKIANRIVYGFDARCLSVIGSGITQTQAVAAAWNTANADQLLDVLLAAAVVDTLDEGFTIDALVLKPVPFARLVAATKILDHAPRETGSNPILTGTMVSFAGLDFMKTNTMPSGVEVMAVDTLNLGSIMWEDQGGGYDGDPSDVLGVESKVIPLETRDGFRIQARKVQEPVLQESGAGVKLTGV